MIEDDLHDGLAVPAAARPYFFDADGRSAPTLTRGEIGCYASHLTLWQRVVRSPAAVLICEDDIHLPENFGDLLKAALACAPQGEVGELGGQVSGGQRQRIALARAFLKDAPIILLDEPTSALDSETEHVIQRALRDLTKGRTTLVIAHRLTTVLSADLIHLVDAGRIVESGTHAELLRAGGAYARLYRLQFADEAVRELAV